MIFSNIYILKRNGLSSVTCSQARYKLEQIRANKFTIMPKTKARAIAMQNAKCEKIELISDDDYR